MALRTRHWTDPSHLRPHGQSARYLVVGREGTMALGGLLSKILHTKGRWVDELISFDHARQLTAYQINTERTKTMNEGPFDILICLSDSGLDYETTLRKSGFLVLDANRVSRRPTRDDVEVIGVPGFTLVHDIIGKLGEETWSRFDPVLSSLLGTIEAIEDDYPDPDILGSVFESLQVDSADLFLTAIYRGYDWLQETRMRGKSARGDTVN